MVQLRRVAIAVWFTAGSAAFAAAQVDDRMALINEGVSPRVFAIDIAPANTISLGGAAEVRQERPPHNYAVLVRNQAAEPASALVVALAVILSDGTVKSLQELPAIKSLKPGQVRRLEARVRGAVLSPTDRVVFVLKTLQREGAIPLWQASDDELRTVIRAAAKRMPVP